MKTLFLTNDFPPRKGGIQTFVRAIAGELPPEDVIVYTSSAPGAEQYDAAQPFPVFRDPATMLLPTPALERRVVRVLRETGATRVVLGASAPLGLLTPSLRRAGAEHVVAMTQGHEVWWARLPVTRQLLRRIADEADEITYLSEWCRERISPALSLEARARMRLLAPTVDTEVFRPGCGGETVRRELGIDPGALVVVCVSRLVRRKGQDTLIRIWPDVLREWPGAVLLLVGDGPDRERLERMVARRGLHACVVFTGEVDEVPPYLDAADVFAMPCRSRLFGLEAEGFGIVYLEAAATGLPVVGGRSGGAPEGVAAAWDLYRAMRSRMPSSSPV